MYNQLKMQYLPYEKWHEERECFDEKISQKGSFLVIFALFILANCGGVTLGAYTYGITPIWDGSGIVPYMDYVHNGIEDFNLYGFGLNINMPIYSAKGRGMDLNLSIAYSDYKIMNKQIEDQYRMMDAGNGWEVTLPYVQYSQMWPYQFWLHLPDGASYNLEFHPDRSGNFVAQINGRDTVTFTIKNGQPTKVVLSDGSYIELIDNLHQRYKDTKGNVVQYILSHVYTTSSSLPIYRLTTLIDSAGRIYYFTYQDRSQYKKMPYLSRIEQDASGYPNGRKTLFESNVVMDEDDGSVKQVTMTVAMTDAVRRTTTFDYQKNHENGWRVMYQITYPNLSRSVYSRWDCDRYLADHLDTHRGITQEVIHKWYRPGENTPFRTEIFEKDYSYYCYTNDGIRGTKSIYRGGGNRNNPYPSRVLEATYSLNGSGQFNELLKKIETDYEFKTYGFARPKSEKTTIYDSNGNGLSATYQYQYDNWGNVTKIIDPYGTETVMAYANTDSDKNLSAPFRVKLINEGSQSIDNTKITSASISQSGGEMSFRFCSTGPTGFTQVKFYIDDVQKYSSSITPSTGWISLNYSLEQGTHTFKWVVTPASNTTFLLDDLLVLDNGLFVDPYYQSAIYTTGVGHRQMLTKATFVKDTVHNTAQTRQTHYKYDDAGNLIQTSEVYNGSYIHTYYTYDSYGNCITQTDGNGNQTLFEYTAEPYTGYPSVYLSRVSRTDGTVLATYGEYDSPLGKPCKVTDPKGNIFRYSYDATGRLLEEKLDDSQVGISRKLEYDDVKNEVTMRYGRDNSWQTGRFSFDPIFGKLTKIERQLANNTWLLIRENHYDMDGRMDWSKDNLEHTVSHAYDELNREIETTSPTGCVTQYKWNGRTLTIVDANKNQQIKNFDLLDRLVSVQEFPKAETPVTTTYTYDNYFDVQEKEPHSNLIRVTNGRGASTTYTYNNLGRLTRVEQEGTNPLAPETYTYDNVGNLRTKSGARGTKTIDYEFFAGYRVKQITEPDGRIVVNTYDPNDNLINQTTSSSFSDYVYDAQNRVTNMTTRRGGNSFTFGYTYDVFGRMNSITYPGRTQPVTYSYDELDRLQSIPGFVTRCKYDGDNKLTKMLLANGLENIYHYDDEDRPDEIIAGDMGDLVDLRYAYDPVGNVKKINVDNYEYDGMNRLTWAGNLPSADILTEKTWGRGTAWDYDAAGNMTSRTVYANGKLQKNTAFTYDLANRLWSMGTTTYGNDAAGARTSKSDGTNNWAYTYDGESRMTRVTKNGSVIEDNVYDGAGMRVSKTNNGKTTYYVYSGANPILEYSASDAASDGKYTYYIFAGDKSIAEESNGKKIFYHRDHLGSTRALTDQDRKLVGLCKYDPWGNLESTNEYDEGVINGDFEMTNASGQVIGWTAINDQLTSGDCLYEKVNGICGRTALRINRRLGSAMTCWARQNLFVSPDTDYTLTGYFVSVNAQTTKAKAQIVYYDSNGQSIYIDSTPALGYSGKWKVFSLSSHSPANAVKMDLRLTTEDAAGAVVFFDGIRLKVPGLAGKYDFTGKRQDEGTGLTYFGARFYDPESCRFVTADTYTNLPNDERIIIRKQDVSNILAYGSNSLKINRYIYTNNNPLSNIDNDGYDARSFWGQIGKITGSYIAGSALSRTIQNLLADKYNYTSKGLFVGHAYSFLRAGRLTTFLTDFFGSLFTGSAGADAAIGALAAQLGKLGNIGLLTFALLLGVQQPCNTNEEEMLYNIQVAKNFEQTIGQCSNSGPNRGFSNTCEHDYPMYDGRCSNRGENIGESEE